MARLMSPRTTLLHKLEALTHGKIHVIEAQTAWPSLVEIVGASQAARVSLHVGLIGGSGRGRDHVERRYQNPASRDPIVELPGTRSMLLGLWTEQETPIIVAHDAYRRIGHPKTRTSLFIGLAALKAATARGWAEYVSDTDERIVAFRPEMFPLYAEMFLGGVLVDQDTMASVFVSADVALDEPSSVERARRATSVLVRSARFREDVVAAYDGCCAMCGLGLGLVEGAHIYPVSAPGSSDDIRNGLALCRNHHAAFDRYLLCIQPSTHKILLHPRLSAATTAIAATAAAAAFVSSTAPYLVAPGSMKDRPSDTMIEQRNSYFEDAYSWVAV